MICVTGKIGSGKSEVSRIISKITGWEVVDVDEIGHEVLEMEDVKSRIVEVFGEDVLKGGKIDRKRLGEIVFSDENLLRKLEEIVHPVMVRIAKESVKGLKNVIIDCALLKRMGLTDVCDFVITVVSSYKTALRRKGMDEERFGSIWRNQEDVKMIGFVIENEGSIEDLERKVRDLLGMIL